MFIKKNSNKKKIINLNITRNKKWDIEILYFLMPAIILLAFWRYIPILLGIVMSFFKINLSDLKLSQFIGFGHYRNMFEGVLDPYFTQILRNTFGYLLVVPIGMAVSLGLALLINQKLKGIGVFRSLLLIPFLTNIVAFTNIMKYFFQPGPKGIANIILSFFGVPPHAWMENTRTAFIVVLIVVIWKNFGWWMILFLAGLQSIPDDFYEAATLDGAGPWHKFKNVTLPLLAPISSFIAIIGVISAFQIMVEPYILSGFKIGPAATGTSFQVIPLMFWIYMQASYNANYGYAAALSMILFVIILIVTLIQFKLIRDRIDY